MPSQVIIVKNNLRALKSITEKIALQMQIADQEHCILDYKCAIGM